MLRPQMCAPGTHAEASGALEWLERRSDRYLNLVAESAGRVAACGSGLLCSLLQSNGCDGSGRASSVRCTTSKSSSFVGGARRDKRIEDVEPLGSVCIFTAGFCSYVIAVLLYLAKRAHFTLVIAEGRPNGDGHRTAQAMLAAGLPARMVEPAAVARYMPQCRLVLCGAHAVLGDGGALAPIGTLNMAFAAKAHGRPMYVASPHFMFSATHHVEAAARTRARARPIKLPAEGPPSARQIMKTHSQLPQENGVEECTASRHSGLADAAVMGKSDRCPRSNNGKRFDASSDPSSCRFSRILVETPSRDAIPPNLITLLLTDIGVLTPSAVADEMLRRRQE